MKQDKENIHRPGWQWLGRSLANYKSMHATTAEKKKVSDAFHGAKTLTQAKKVLFGLKKGMTK